MKEKNEIYMKVSLENYAVDYVSNIIYSQQTAGGYLNQLKLDLLIPRSEKKLPLVVFLMGAGFLEPCKDGFLQQRMQVAEHGYVVASIEYSGVPAAIFPLPLIDSKAAIRYLKAHADEFNIDKERVGVWGCSAGAYYASLLGTTNGVEIFEKGDNLEENSDVSCVVDMYGPSDLTRIGEGLGKSTEESHYSASTTEALLINGMTFLENQGGNIFSNLEKVKIANPATYISEATVPFLIFHGTNDPLVSPVSTKILHDKLIENGIESTLYLIEGAEHGSEEFFQKKIIDIIIKFLDEKLKKTIDK